MAAKRKRRKKADKLKLKLPQWAGIALTAAALCWALLLAVQEHVPLPVHIPAYEDIRAAIDELYGYGVLAPEPLMPGEAPAVRPADGNFELHMIDVGQALCVLARAPTGESLLIDAGDRDDAKTVTNYLSQNGVEKLDYLIATHAHADHIGGMAQVVRGVDIGTVIMSGLPKELTPTTKAYNDLLEAIAAKGLQITLAKPGASYALGGAQFEIEGPVKTPEDLNNSSVVCRIRYGERAFLVQGDAEKEEEETLIRARRAFPSDVLIAGHHGSSTSTSDSYLKAVSPQYVGISCGLGNSYGHPHKETIEKLRRFGSAILRTDVNGTVVFYSDGRSMQIVTEKE